MVALIVLAVGVGLFAVIFAIMWIPTRGGENDGWLFLYPLFLLAWLPTELMGVASLILGIIALARRHQRKAVSIGVVIGSLLFVALSLPLLWFGTFPWFLLNPNAW